ncbi:hypothetical protein G6011_03546 [Alternaria panax]|uniref:Uncharacterized protein n=1 Tax=Alternaria panax TaxID=48097 RepID=A0AAD4IEX9_9PLEO|nr:hypothetical protein G6011_03546 [Alternaria panax]
MWSYTIDRSEASSNSDINVPEPFDQELRKIEARHVRSFRRPSIWIGPSKAKITFAESAPPARQVIKVAEEVGQEDAQLDELLSEYIVPSHSRQAQIKAHLDSLGPRPKSTSSKNSHFSTKADDLFDFDDEDLDDDFSELTLLDSVPWPSSSSMKRLLRWS